MLSLVACRLQAFFQYNFCMVICDLSLSWYHGPMSRAEATQILENEREGGVFLVRDSTSMKGDYVLCVRWVKSSSSESNTSCVAMTTWEWMNDPTCITSFHSQGRQQSQSLHHQSSPRRWQQESRLPNWRPDFLWPARPSQLLQTSLLRHHSPDSSSEKADWTGPGEVRLRGQRE